MDLSYLLCVLLPLFLPPPGSMWSRMHIFITYAYIIYIVMLKCPVFGANVQTSDVIIHQVDPRRGHTRFT